MCKLFKKEAKKYALKYDYKDWYQGAKDYYAPGERVALKYDCIATDTSYSFYLNGESINYSYHEYAFFISFNMPECDSYLECRSQNTMVYREQ